MYQDRLRSMRWHAATAEFRILDGPTVVSITETAMTVRWTMSEVCSGQVEYGTASGALTSSTTNQSISGGYSTHIQDISGLSPATAYYFRTKSTSASAITVYSDEQTVTTDGTVPLPTGLGPRYSEYTGVAGGTFPTFPSGAGVVVAPTSILSASDKGLALGQWISAQADNATMVLDSSGAGTAYGAGTEYVINDNVYIHPGNGVMKTGQTLWMYNTRIRSTNTAATGRVDKYGSRILLFAAGGWKDFSILGGTLQGANSAAGTYTCRTLGPESGHGITITNYQGLDIRDVRIRNVMGDAINLTQWDVTLSAHNVGWAYPSDCEIGWCLIDGTGRQGIVPQQITGLWVHHCEVYDAALSTYDSEDMVYTPSGYRFMRNVLVEDSVFRGLNWNITVSGGNYHNWFLMVAQEALEIDTVDDFIVRRCRFEDGHSGWGNPDAEVAVLGSIVNGGAGNSGVHTMASPAPWYALSRCRYSTNLQFVDNYITLPPNQRNGYAIYLRNWHGITITGNDLAGRSVRALDCSSVTFSGNSAGSTLVTI